MSGESIAHVKLVESLISLVEGRVKGRSNVLLLADHHRFGRERPPQLGGFTPDLFASDVLSTFRIVGEAKTVGDIDSDRSANQLGAFLDHLALYPEGSLYVAVPWVIAPRARALLKRLRREHHARVIVEIIPCP